MPTFEPRPQSAPNIGMRIRYQVSYDGDYWFVSSQKKKTAVVECTSRWTKSILERQVYNIESINIC